MIVAREGSVSQKQLDAFVQELNLIYESAPQTGWLAKKFVNNIK
jgi:hypothetical protein